MYVCMYVCMYVLLFLKNDLSPVESSVPGEAGINVHDVLPVTTPRGKQMMPPADRIYDPSQGAKKDLTNTGDDFLAIGPALQIMQLNDEGLSAAKFLNSTR